MAVTLTNSQLSAGLYSAFWNRAPDATGQNFWVGQLNAGTSLLSVATEFYNAPEGKAAYPNWIRGNNAALVTQAYESIFERAPDADGLAFYVAQLNGGASFPQVVINMMTNAVNSAAAGNTDGMQFLNEIQVGVYVAETLRTDDPNITSIALQGVTYEQSSVYIREAELAQMAATTYTLTTGIDNLSAGGGVVYFDGSLTAAGAQTLNGYDSLRAGTGVDTLDATITTSVTPGLVQGVENVNVTFQGVSTLNLINATGYDSIANRNSTATGIVSNINSTDVALAVKNVANGTTFQYQAAVVAGTNDAATVDLEQVTGGASVTIQGIENLTLTSNRVASDVDIIDVDATSITVTGTADLSIDNQLGTVGNAQNVTLIDASGFAGDFTVTTGALGNSAVAVSVLGGLGDDDLDVSGVLNVVSVDAGAGDDIITVGGNLNNFDHVDGGLGFNVLSTANAITAADAVGISNIQGLEFTATATQDLDAISGITAVAMANTAAQTLTLTNASAALDTLDVSVNTTAVSLARKVDTGANALEVTIGDVTSPFAAVTLGTLTVNNEETLTVASVGAANTITTLNAADLTTLNVVGAQNLTVTNPIAGAVNLATVNAILSTGSVSVDASQSLVDMTVTAGSGSLTATSGSGNDTLMGSERADSLTSGNGNDAIYGYGGDDTLIGGAGNDILVGGAGADSIESGAGVDSIDAGAGNDTVNVGTNYTTADTISGGEGANTLVIGTGAVAATTTTPAVTNFQTVDVTFGAANTLSLADSAATNLVIVENDALDVAVSVTNIASGATVRNLDADDAPNAGSLTLDTVAAATLTVDARVAGPDLVVTDAASVTIRNGGAAAGSFASTTLDNIDTTSLTVTGGTGGTLGTGAIAGTDKVASLGVTSQTAAMTVTLGDMADADSLTSLNVAGAFGNVVIGEVGGTGTAEGLASVTVTAASGSAVTLDEIWAQTVASATPNAMTLTSSATNGSSVTFSSIDNTGGSVTAAITGDGAVNFTGGAATIAASDVTMTRSGAGATTIDAIDAGNDVNITVSSSGGFTITTIDAEGDMLIDASTSTGALTVTSTSTSNTSIYGGSAADTIVATTSNGARLEGNGGADSLVGGNGDDIILGGTGADTITAGTGVDSIDGGADNDTIILGANLTNDDTIDGGAGVNTATLTTAALLTTPSLANIQTVDVMFGGNHTLALTNSAATNLVINELTAAAQTVAVTGVATGATFRNLDDDDLMTVDTAAGATLTLDQRFNGNNAGSFTVTDAATVNFVNGSAAATNADFANGTAVTLDNVDTTTVNVTGASVANSTLEIAVGSAVGGDAFLNTNALQSVNVTTSTTGATVLVGQIDDADALTTLSVTAANANATVGAIGAVGTAENLASITASASGTGVTASVGAITADTTNSTTDLGMTVAASAGTLATTTFGAINNQFGTITLNATGQGAVNVTGALTAVDVTVSRTDTGASTLAGITASGTADLTLAGAGTFTLATASVDGDLTIDASLKSGSLVMQANASTGDATITGGSAADTIYGSSGNDSLTSNAGNDSIVSGAGNDTISAGSGDDTINMTTFLAAGDSIDGGTGDNTLLATINASRTAVISNVQTLTFDISGGAFNAINTTGADTINLVSATEGNVVFTNLANTVTDLNQNEDANTVSFGYRAGAAASVLLNYSGATEAITNASTTFSNVAALEVDGDTGFNVALGSLAGGAALTSLTVDGFGNALNTGNLTADNLQTLAITTGGAGAVTVGTLLSANDLTSLSITGGAFTGDVNLGTIGFGGGNAASLTSVEVTTDINGATVVNMADIDASNADITTFAINLDGNYDASDIGTVTADSISSVDITTTALGTSFTVTEFILANSVGDINITNGAAVTITNGFTMGAAATVGNVTVTASDTVTIGKIEGAVIGDIVASNSGAATTVGFGTVGDTGGTVGNITFSDDGDFSVTVTDVLTVGDVDTTAATGTNTVTLNNGTLVGVNMTGGDGVDVFTGTGAADVISVGANDDSISGGFGADTMTGGTGANTFRFGAAADVTAGTPDTITDLDASGTNVLSFDGAGAGSFALVGGNVLAYFEGAQGTFAETDNVVVVTTAVVGALTSANAATAIGSATGAYGIGNGVLFLVSNNTDSAVFKFTSAAADATVTAAELGAGSIISLTGINSAELAGLAAGNFVLAD